MPGTWVFDTLWILLGEISSYKVKFNSKYIFKNSYIYPFVLFKYSWGFVSSLHSSPFALQFSPSTVKFFNFSFPLHRTCVLFSTCLDPLPSHSPMISFYYSGMWNSIGQHKHRHVLKEVLSNEELPSSNWSVGCLWGNFHD